MFKCAEEKKNKPEKENNILKYIQYPKTHPPLLKMNICDAHFVLIHIHSHSHCTVVSGDRQLAVLFLTIFLALKPNHPTAAAVTATASALLSIQSTTKY